VNWRPGCSPAREAVPAPGGPSPAGRGHREFRRKHVTLAILWEEYIAGEPGGYRYSRFCELYRAWEGRLSVAVQQLLAAGDKLLVDNAGDGVPVMIDRLTGKRRAAQIFVAVLGASSFAYAQATWTQGSPIGSAAMSAPSRRSAACLLVPDNTKLAVIKGVPLRSADQPQLCRRGDALPHRHSAGQAATATAAAVGNALAPSKRSGMSTAPGPLVWCNRTSLPWTAPGIGRPQTRRVAIAPDLRSSGFACSGMGAPRPQLKANVAGQETCSTVAAA
jgi:hypothetical protein